MSGKSLFVVAALVFALMIGANSVYIVNEFERAVELRLGKVVDADVPKGLHFKIPFIDNVRRFDGRILTLDAPAERFLTLEKKSMRVDSFAKWRIVDVAKYYTATSGEEERARSLLSRRINEELRNQFALRSLQEVVSGERDSLMVDIKKELNAFSDTSLGIELIDVRVKRIDLPEEVSGPVFQRMRAERQKEAAEHRAVGQERAKVIRAEADKEATVMLAIAYRDSEKLRGEGDAKASEVYANAYNRDPEFYAFVRSMQAYKKTFAEKQDVMLVDPKSDFFRYFNDSAGEIKGSKP